MPKKTKKRKLRIKLGRRDIIWLSAAGSVALLLILAGLWLYTNTSIFPRKISQEALNQNNLNETNSSIPLVAQEVDGKIVNTPEDMTVSVYARGIQSARFFAFGPSDTMFVGSSTDDGIYVVRDMDGDGTAEDVKKIDKDLNTPHSVFYYNGDLYLAEETRVSVYRNMNEDGTYEKKDVIIDNLPGGNRLTGGGHKTRTVAVGPDNKLYVSIGSSCNVCVEDDQRRATIMRYNLDGSSEETLATGLRNTVGFDFNDAGELYGADMGRDLIGDDTPPEEINKIEQGKNYGWPYCYGNKINNPEYKDRMQYCMDNTSAPSFEMQAHSAPLGFLFMKALERDVWPEQFQNGYFVALHGSWNRTTPTGYKFVWVDTSGPQPKLHNFLTGFLDDKGSVWGRPVGLGFDSNGNLYVSDDKQGLIYKITPR
jgi:glucose/arabinose dehydrogenase